MSGQTGRLIAGDWETRRHIPGDQETRRHIVYIIEAIPGPPAVGYAGPAMQCYSFVSIYLFLLI